MENLWFISEFREDHHSNRMLRVSIESIIDRMIIKKINKSKTTRAKNINKIVMAMEMMRITKTIKKITINNLTGRSNMLME